MNPIVELIMKNRGGKQLAAQLGASLAGHAEYDGQSASPEEKKKQDLTECPSGHRLKLICSRSEVPTYTEDPTCDVCEKTLPLAEIDPQGSFQHCSRCSYNVCRRCVYIELWEQAR